MKGFVSNYLNDKGYGFINYEGSSIFFHISNMIHGRIPEVGNMVTFEVSENEKGKKATNILIVDEIPKHTYINIDSVRIKTSNIKSYGINDESKTILAELMEEMKRYDEIIKTGQREKLIYKYDFAKRFSYNNTQKYEHNDNYELENRLYRDTLQAQLTGDIELIKTTNNKYKNFLKDKLKNREIEEEKRKEYETKQKEINAQKRELENEIRDLSYNDWYIINRVESSYFKEKLQKAQNGELSYLYITTYQGDNYKFYHGCSFNIFDKVEELDNLLV